MWAARGKNFVYAMQFRVLNLHDSQWKLHKKIDSLPNAYVEKVSEYVEFLLWNLNTNTKIGNSIEGKKTALENMEKYRGRLHLPENFDIFISATTVVNSFYIMRKDFSEDEMKDLFLNFLQFADVTFFRSPLLWQLFRH